MAAAITLVLGACEGDRASAERNETSPADASSTPAMSENLGSYIVDLNTGEKTPLPEPLQGGDSYQVSPDGTMFAYTLRISPYDGYVANVDGTGVREIRTPRGREALAPSWSPDGSLLVYQGRRAGFSKDPFIGDDLYLVDVATGNMRQVVDLRDVGSWHYLDPRFGPKGKTILFQMTRVGDQEASFDLWSVPVAGGKPVLVRRDAAFGAYSPDGRTLAYLDSPLCCARGWTSSLWLVDADGNDPRLLVDDDVSWLRWSLDGTRIAYAADGEVGVVDVATGEIAYVADGGTVEWLDADTLVVGPG